jgi:hypothetical protein
MRDRLRLLLFAFWCCSIALSARADDDESLGAKLGCEPALSVGRVRCSLSLTAPPGSRFSWVDALVVKTPPFARALRTRVAQPVRPNQSQIELALGLVASGEGTAELSVRARAVVCPTANERVRCRALTRVETLELRVGAGPAPP